MAPSWIDLACWAVNESRSIRLSSEPFKSLSLESLRRSRSFSTLRSLSKSRLQLLHLKIWLSELLTSLGYSFLSQSSLTGNWDTRCTVICQSDFQRDGCQAKMLTLRTVLAWQCSTSYSLPIQLLFISSSLLPTIENPTVLELLLQQLFCLQANLAAGLPCSENWKSCFWFSLLNLPTFASRY